MVSGPKISIVNKDKLILARLATWGKVQAESWDHDRYRKAWECSLYSLLVYCEAAAKAILGRRVRNWIGPCRICLDIYHKATRAIAGSNCMQFRELTSPRWNAYLDSKVISLTGFCFGMFWVWTFIVLECSRKGLAEKTVLYDFQTLYLTQDPNCMYVSWVSVDCTRQLLNDVEVSWSI